MKYLLYNIDGNPLHCRDVHLFNLMHFKSTFIPLMLEDSANFLYDWNFSLLSKFFLSEFLYFSIASVVNKIEIVIYSLGDTVIVEILIEFLSSC